MLLLHSVGDKRGVFQDMLPFSGDIYIHCSSLHSVFYNQKISAGHCMHGVSSADQLQLGKIRWTYLLSK